MNERSERTRSFIPIVAVICGTAFAAWVVHLGNQFFFNAFYNPDTPYLPEGQQAVTVIVFWTSIMTIAVQSVFAMTMVILTSWYQSRAVKSGQDAALSVPGQKESTDGA